MPTIDINVQNKVATAPQDAYIICGNTNYVINFIFDAEWDEYNAKTARFKYNGVNVDVPFTGNQCRVPIISDSMGVEIGVYSGTLTTTTGAMVECKKSVLCGSGLPQDPAENVYLQLIELINGMQTGGAGEEEIAAAVAAYMAENPVSCNIKRVESLDEENIVNLRDLESGTYILYGYFRPFAGSDTVLTFPNNLAVGIVTKAAGTHVQIPYPVNNCIQFLEITDESYERKDVYLNDYEIHVTKTEDGTYTTDAEFSDVVYYHNRGRRVAFYVDGLNGAELIAENYTDTIISASAIYNQDGTQYTATVEFNSDNTMTVNVSSCSDEIKKLSNTIDEQGKTIPKVFQWANAELPFTESEISGVVSGGGFVVNPTNFADGETYFRYNAGSSYGFRWTNPNPQKGSLTITMRGYSQYSETLSTKIVTVYTDGTDNGLTDMMYLKHGETVTYTTDPDKTVDYIRGNYDFENWVLLDMDVLSIVADYPAPTGTVKSVNGNLPDENGNVQITIPSGGGSGGTDIALGISGATVGQIARITAVDDAGAPTAWEAVELPNGNSGDDWDIHYKTNITEPLEEGFEITEVDGEPLKLREMWAMVKLQNGSETNQWMGCSVTTDNASMSLSSTSAGHGGKDVSVNGYAYYIYHAQVIGNGRAVCKIAVDTTAPQYIKTSSHWLNNWLDYNPVNYISGIKCDNNLGAGTPQGNGTEIEIWGKRA